MTEAERFADTINARLGTLKSGSLRIWGSWFGKPYDNEHHIVSSLAEEDVLRIRFDNDELLSVWSPDDLIANDSAFRILGAARVHWDWYYHGRPQVPENLFFEDFVRGQTGTTNATWYPADLRTDLSLPAVELL